MRLERSLPVVLAQVFLALAVGVRPAHAQAPPPAQAPAATQAPAAAQAPASAPTPDAAPAAAPARGPYELAGIKVGMTIREALMALKAHNPKMQLQDESLPYPGLPRPLTYGLNAVGEGEGFYFLLAMPPSEPRVSKLTWVIHFNQDNLPRQDVLVGNLVKQFGRISSDTLPISLDVGSRDLYWIDDAQGNRIVSEEIPKKCRNQSAFYLTGVSDGPRPRFDPTKVHLPVIAARLRIEQGFVNKSDPAAEECGDYTMVRARLFKARYLLLGASVPNIVDYMVLMIASGPLDRKTTKDTHQYWLANAKPAPSPQQKSGPPPPDTRPAPGDLRKKGN
jgi:hypothetical protein